MEWAFGNVMFQTVDRNSFLELTWLTERMFYLYTNGEKMMTEQAGLKIGELTHGKYFTCAFSGVKVKILSKGATDFKCRNFHMRYFVAIL